MRHWRSWRTGSWFCDRIGHAGQISCLSFPPSYFPLSRSLLVKYTELSRNLCPCPSLSNSASRFSYSRPSKPAYSHIPCAFSAPPPPTVSRLFSWCWADGRWQIDGGRRNHVCGEGFSRSGLACRYICRLQVPFFFFFCDPLPAHHVLCFFFFFLTISTRLVLKSGRREEERERVDCGCRKFPTNSPPALRTHLFHLLVSFPMDDQQ